jgi:hypothetical protein
MWMRVELRVVAGDSHTLRGSIAKLTIPAQARETEEQCIGGLVPHID